MLRPNPDPRSRGRKDFDMLYVTGGLFLLLLVIGSKTAWSNEKEIFDKDLVFVEKSRSLVGVSLKFQREVKKREREESLIGIRTIWVWSAENGRVEDTLYFPPKGGPRAIDSNPNGDGVTAALWNPPARGEKYGHSSIAYYSLTEKKWLWSDDWPSEFGRARRVKFSSDGLRVIGVGFKNMLVYDARIGKKLEAIGEPLKDYPLLSDSVRGSVLSPSGRYIVIWQEPAPSGHLLGRWIANKWVTVWDLQTRKQVARWRKPEYVNFCAAFTRDEKHILFGSGIDSRGHIRMWSVERQEMIRDWSLGDGVCDMKFSEDYRYLAVYLAGEDLSIRVYDYSNEKEVHSFRGVGSSTFGEPTPMTFFDGSDFFAFAKKDQVCVYNTKTWEEKWCSP